MKFIKKVVRKRTNWVKENYPQVELNVDHQGTQALVIAGADGWNYKPYDCRGGRQQPGWHQGHGDSRSMNIRISMNGPLKMTYAEWRALVDAVENAYVDARQEWAVQQLRASNDD
jgi:hypothetical protein